SDGSAVTIASGPCSDVAGNTYPGLSSATYHIGARAPTVSSAGFGSGTAGNAPWYVSAVTENFSASDTTSGLADCAASFTKTSSKIGRAACRERGHSSDVAGNTNPSLSSASYHIDNHDHTITDAEL